MKRGDLECWCWFTGSWEAIAANSSVKRSNYTRLRPVKQKISLLTNIVLWPSHLSGKSKASFSHFLFHLHLTCIWKVECMSALSPSSPATQHSTMCSHRSRLRQPQNIFQLMVVGSSQRCIFRWQHSKISTAATTTTIVSICVIVVFIFHYFTVRQYSFFNAVSHKQGRTNAFLFLPNAMRSIHGLQFFPHAVEWFH